jgi:type II secretory pathway component PulF
MVGTKSRLAQSYYDMATLLDAGVPIMRSVDILTEGRQGQLKRTFGEIRESLSKGSSLSESVDQHHNVFPEMDRMLIQAAETSGSLGDSFKMLSEWHEFVHRITRRMQMGLIYPFFILHIAAFVVNLPAFVLGKISMGEYLMRVLSILAFLYIPTILVVVSIRLRDRIPLLRLPLDFIALRIPVLGQAIYHMSVCRYAKAFAMLYKAGVPMTETTERATRATGNVLVARQFAGACETVRQGATAWEGFSRRLPAEYRHLWQIGEETGELDKVAAKVADISGDRADLFFTAFASGFPKVVYFAIMIVMVVMVLRMWSQVYSSVGAF